ncbi:MAG: DUF4374 domain-containing protein [Myxococcota bacterium]
MHLKGFRLIAALAVCAATFTGCGDDSDGGDDGDNGQAFDAAYAINQRVFTADGDRFQAINILPNLDEQELPLDQSFEFSGFSRLRVLDGKVFIFESERGEVIRYRVTPTLQLEEENRLSFADLGIINFDTAITMDSPTRAYFVDFDNRLVIFNPESMERVGEISFAERSREGFESARVSAPVRIGDELYVSIAWSDQTTLEYVPAATVAVFSISEERLLRVISDNRCGYGYRGFAFDGAFYTLGEQVDGIANVLNPDLAPAPCLLRVQGGAETFDPDYYVDLSAASDRPLVTSGPNDIGGGRFLVQVYDTDTDPSSLTLNEYVLSEPWRWSVMTLPDADTVILDGLPLGGTNPFNPSFVDGLGYVSVLAGDASSSRVFSVDVENNTAPSVRSSAGEIVRIERVF